MIRKKIMAYICTFAILLTIVQPVYAETEDEYTTEENPFTIDFEPFVIASATEVEGIEQEEAVDVLELTVEDAVAYGLENSIILENFYNEIEIASITETIMEDNYDDLEDAENLLDYADYLIEEGEEELTTAKTTLNTAVYYFENYDIAPQAVIIDGSTLVETGAAIYTSLENLDLYYYGTTGAGIFTAYYDDVCDGISYELDEAQEEIQYSSIALTEAGISLDLATYQYEDALATGSDEVDDILGYSSSVTYDVDDLGELMVNVAGVNYDVTRYAKGIYQNQIAMLIQSNYYDALYAGKVVELKAVAMARGEAQFNAVALSYENGMKAKDDYLLSKMYYDGTIIAYRLAQANYTNALYELKENINLDMDTEIKLVDSMIDEVTEESLEEGLDSGLSNRVEIRQALGTLELQELNEDIIDDMYSSGSTKREEADLLVTQAELNLELTEAQITSEIYQSYELMCATGDMLELSSELITNAAMVVEIAELKYELGYGADNSLLSSLGLESSSGTIIELLAAQENLADMEAQVAEIYYSYTMAKIKYYNDAGMLIY